MVMPKTVKRLRVLLRNRVKRAELNKAERFMASPRNQVNLDSAVSRYSACFRRGENSTANATGGEMRLMYRSCSGRTAPDAGPLRPCEPNFQPWGRVSVLLLLEPWHCDRSMVLSRASRCRWRTPIRSVQGCSLPDIPYTFFRTSLDLIPSPRCSAAKRPCRNQTAALTFKSIVQGGMRAPHSGGTGGLVREA